MDAHIEILVAFGTLLVSIFYWLTKTIFRGVTERLDRISGLVKDTTKTAGLAITEAKIARQEVSDTIKGLSQVVTQEVFDLNNELDTLKCASTSAAFDIRISKAHERIGLMQEANKKDSENLEDLFRGLKKELEELRACITKLSAGINCD